jgi:hypothetical protein
MNWQEELKRKRDEWLALSDEEREAIIQMQRKLHFDELTGKCPMWRCECKQAYVFRTQDDLIESPFQCPTCDRVYDGRDWFRTTQLYNSITNWENLQTEASWLLGEISLDGDADEKSSYDEVRESALDLMDICDTVTHQDVTPIWRYAAAIWDRRRPLEASEASAVKAAEAACRPIIELLWYKARTKPWDPSEWESNALHSSGLMLRRRERLRPQQQEIVDVIREAGRRLTTDEVLQALQRNGKRRSEGTTKTTLAVLVQFGPLTNATDNYGRGYGLPEWSNSEG